MLLIEALAHKSHIPITVINGCEIGRQFRWGNGRIQTKPANGKHWNRITKISAWLLENAEIDDCELL